MLDILSVADNARMLGRFLPEGVAVDDVVQHRTLQNGNPYLCVVCTYDIEDVVADSPEQQQQPMQGPVQVLRRPA